MTMEIIIILALIGEAALITAGWLLVGPNGVMREGDEE